jgi:hypothetical protein
MLCQALRSGSWGVGKAPTLARIARSLPSTARLVSSSNHGTGSPPAGGGKASPLRSGGGIREGAMCPPVRVWYRGPHPRALRAPPLPRQRGREKPPSREASLSRAEPREGD